MPNSGRVVSAGWDYFIPTAIRILRVLAFVMERQPWHKPLGPPRETKSEPAGLAEEASTGFEPVMRVLQTLALPLGHDASSLKTRAGDGIRTHDLLLGKETFYH